MGRHPFATVHRVPASHSAAAVYPRWLAAADVAGMGPGAVVAVVAAAGDQKLQDRASDMDLVGMGHMDQAFGTAGDSQPSVRPAQSIRMVP